MFGTIVSLLGTAASTVGGIISNKKKEKTMAANQARDNAWYQQQLYQDPTKRSDNAALLRQLDKQQKKATELATNKAKVTGQSGMVTNAMTMAQQANANAYADAVSDMAAKESQRRDSLNQQWQANREKYDAQQQEMEDAKAANWGALANNAAQLGASAINGMQAGSANKDAGAEQNNAQAAAQAIPKDKPDAVTVPDAVAPQNPIDQLPLFT